MQQVSGECAKRLWLPAPRSGAEVETRRKARHRQTSSLTLRDGAPDTIRTCDLCLRRATLYPAELRVQQG